MAKEFLAAMPSQPFGMVAAALMLASTSPAYAAAETDWWRTNGAAVVEYRTGSDEAACSLFLYNKENAAVVTWKKSGPEDISFYHSDWQFETDHPLSVGVRLGDFWLGSAAAHDPPQLTAIADQGRLSVPVNEPVDGLLRNASRITVQLADHETSIDVDRPKMPVLLAAVNRCRAALK
jgi:hypothetical protein